MPGGNKIIRFPGQEAAGALEFRVDLLMVSDPVWRRFVTPSSYSFWDLHVAIQDSFGWGDVHLHQFTLDDPRSGQRIRFGIPDERGFHGRNEVLAGWEHPLMPYVRVDGHPVLYTYDFGSDWQHEVVLVDQHRQEDLSVLPRCLEGSGMIPGDPGDEGPTADSFDPERVQFDNPRQRWERSFGHD